MNNTKFYYKKKLTQVLNQIDKIEFQTQEGERLLERYEVDRVLGDLYSENKIEIAQNILSILGINAPKNFKYDKI